MTIDKDNLCNWCVMTCNLPQDSKEQERGGCRVDAYGLVDAVVIGGYFSTPGNGCGAFDDCTNHRFSLCEFCLNHLFRLFKIPVSVCTLHIAWSDFISQTIVSDNHDGPEVWAPAEERVKRDDWRKMKDKFFDEFNRRNEARGKK